MNFIYKFLRRGVVTPTTLVATAFFALITVFGISILPETNQTGVTMRIEPLEKIAEVGDTFEIEIITESKVPVNVFAGELHFDHNVLAIKSIDYNTSIADLWTEKPWYSNGAGTLNFAGGTTRKGGFLGTDTLIKITFETTKEGEGIITLNKPRILLHDGLGTDAKLTASIDTLIVIESPENNSIADETSASTVYQVVKEPPSTDINGDGKQSMADISIFMLKITGNDPRYDFNLDGEVNIKDLNILLDAK